MERAITTFKFIVVSFVLFIILIFTNDMQSNQEINLKNIKIQDSDNDLLDKQIILKYLKERLVSIDGVLMSDFSKEKLENILMSHPGIKEVEVFASQIGDLNILIEQKNAIVRVKSNDDDYYLDELGEIMQLSANYTPKLVVATGDIAIRDHVGIYNFIKEINKSDFWNAQITQVHFEKHDILLIPRVGDQKIYIGSFENIAEKLDNLYQFYKIVMPVKGWQAYSDINLKFNNQIVCLKK